MDRETQIAPASGAHPPDAWKTAVERRPPDPPGLDAIRRFFRRPWIQGIWAWLCMISRGIQVACKWLDRNAGPIARGIVTAGNSLTRVSPNSTATMASPMEGAVGSTGGRSLVGSSGRVGGESTAATSCQSSRARG